MTDVEASTSKNVQSNQAEDSEEIPEYTVVALTDNKIKKINMEKYAVKRVINLYISHLLDTDKVKIETKFEKHFCTGNMIFRNIMVRGIITEVRSLKFKTKNRTLISVDDGTAVLDCYAEPNQSLETLRGEVLEKLEDSRELAVLHPKNNLLKAAFMMLQSSQKQLQKLLSYTKLHRGDTVELIGNLSEYSGKRTCFISSIIKDSTIGNTRYLEDLDSLYQTVYL